jgi:hypothetical protein
MVTIQMSVEKGSSLDQTTAMTLLQKYWAPKVAEFNNFSPKCKRSHPEAIPDVKRK